ncbi:MAG: hypothetical protein A3H79_03455 [Candidatus Levybacteria bacterium RIFCSPLOWO2_02_FULL_36_8b]|nr:MAG: hypothetical protein A3H79_03455 [Candidatus Levybacteria bacterium RIFCSPLOWO2_02_FULL_36_8b]
MTLIKILKWLERSREFWFALLISFLFFWLRLPSLFEPLWYGDEGIYQAIGNSLNNGKLLYREIFDNKPPLLYWLYSFFHSDQFTIRLASLIFGIFSIIFFFLLAKKLFKHNKNIAHFLATSVFAVLYGLPILEGNIANAENFMLFPIIFAGFLIFDFAALRPKFLIFTAGLLLGIAFLFKIVAIFDLLAFLIFCFIANFNVLKQQAKLFLIAVGFFLPILAVGLFFFLNNTFTDFINAVFLANISYGFPFLFAKLILLGGFILYVFIKRKEISKTALFILLWLAFSMFNAFFSQRPYAHYILVLLPSLSLMMGLIIYEKKYQKIIGILSLIVLVIVIKHFNISNYKKNISYYKNFINYIKGEKTTAVYQAFFDSNTPFDYEIARFIKPKINKNDTIFVWGNNAQLYQMIGVIPSTKYIVAYQLSNHKNRTLDTKLEMEKIKPKFIVVMPYQEEMPFPLIGYFQKIEINKTAIYEKLF